MIFFLPVRLDLYRNCSQRHTEDSHQSPSLLIKCQREKKHSHSGRSLRNSLREANNGRPCQVSAHSCTFQLGEQTGSSLASKAYVSPSFPTLGLSGGGNISICFSWSHTHLWIQNLGVEGHRGLIIESTLLRTFSYLFTYPSIYPCSLWNLNHRYVLSLTVRHLEI